MRIGRRVDRWVRKYGTPIILLTLVLSIVPLPLTYLIFIYQEQQNYCDRNTLETQNDANYRAFVDRLLGEVADPIKIQNCMYAVQFQRNLSENITVRACVWYVITRANGTVEAPSHPSC